MLYALTPEVRYPTELRATGLGSCHVVHAIAGVIGPLLGGALISARPDAADDQRWVALLERSPAAAAVAGLAPPCLALPETRASQMNVTPPAVT